MTLTTSREGLDAAVPHQEFGVDDPTLIEALNPLDLRMCKDFFAERQLIHDGRLLSRLFDFVDAVTDERLAVRVGEEMKRLIPGGNMSESSWSFHRSNKFLNAWRSLQWKLFKLAGEIYDLENSEQSNQTSTQEVRSYVEARIEQIEKEIFEKLYISSREYARQILDYFPESLQRENSRHYEAGSGADAIVSVYDLLIKLIKGGTLIFSENGSKVKNGLSQRSKQRGESHIDLSLRKDEDNSLISSTELFEQVKYAVEHKNVRMISLSLVSKTGERYDVSDELDQVSLVERVLDYVEQFNHEQQKLPVEERSEVFVVLDAVQLFGRRPTDEVFRLFEHSATTAIVHTGSKAIGGPPHGGTVWMKEKAWELVKNSWLDQDENLHRVMEVNGLAGEALHELSSEAPEDIFTALRGIENYRKIDTFLHTPESRTLYSENARKLATILQQFGEALGCRCLDLDKQNPRDIISIISFEIPPWLEPSVVKDRIIPELSSSGIEVGGYLQEGGARPILRISLEGLSLYNGLSEEELYRLLYFGDSPFGIHDTVNGLAATFTDMRTLAQEGRLRDANKKLQTGLLLLKAIPPNTIFGVFAHTMMKAYNTQVRLI